MMNHLYNNSGKKVATSKLAAQLHYECMGWARLLEFFKLENSALKTRLSEVLDMSSDKELLAQAEHFQNRFILKDEFIDEITRDVKHHQSQINDTIQANENPSEKLIRRQQKLRNEIMYLERNFTSVKHDFNKYLSAAIQ
ncbi:MAG: hypothetical protein RLY16_2663 [Bacteroidota bacterium]